MNLIMKFVRDDNKIFLLDGSRKGSAAWGITSIDGLGNIEDNISTEVPAIGDGAELVSERVPSRPIDVVAVVKDAENNMIERNKAISFFNVKHSFTIYITRNDTTRWINAKIQKIKCPEQRDTKKVQVSLALICVNPYFYSEDNFGKNIASVKAGFGFPYISPIGKGFQTGVFNFAKQIEIENTGDVETYATIVIEAYGNVRNPKVMQNEAYIRLKDNLVNGDAVRIDLVENRISKNGENCICKVDRKSSFSGMVLKTGDNTISFSADDGDTNMKVMLYYNLKYLGV